MLLFCLLFFALVQSVSMFNISSLFTQNSSFLFYFSLEPVDIPHVRVVNPFQDVLLAAFLQVKYTPCLKLVRNFRIYTLNISQIDNQDISELKSTELSFRIPILFKMQLEIYNFFSGIFYFPQDDERSQ